MEENMNKSNGVNIDWQDETVIGCRGEPVNRTRSERTSEVMRALPKGWRNRDAIKTRVKRAVELFRAQPAATLMEIRDQIKDEFGVGLGGPNLRRAQAKALTAARRDHARALDLVGRKPKADDLQTLIGMLPEVDPGLRELHVWIDGDGKIEKVQGRREFSA